MTDPTMKKTAGDGVELALAVWEGKGKTVFCVHGISGNCRCWDHVAEALAFAGYELRSYLGVPQRGPFGDAGGAQAAPFARIGHQPLMPTRFAAKPGKAL